MKFLFLLFACTSAWAQSQTYASRPDVRAFIEEMVTKHNFVERELDYLFSRARRQPQILTAIVPPKEPRDRSWKTYRGRFVTEARIGEGVEFWRRHAALLERAAREHGVPEEIIVAIIGIETVYGRQMGTHRVIDALATLAFDYPPRAEYFRSELVEYLRYTRETGTDVFSMRGSYAGAIGIPQFMPASYRKYAVDFDGDGNIDLRGSPADAIGSVANFLAKHGWRRDERIYVPARVSGTAHRALIDAGIEPVTPLKEVKAFGVEARTDLPLDTLVALVDLESPGIPTEYRLGLRNFYVITRYNRSALYASAVTDLAQELRSRK
jgi:membrane-bound lytic murein transglycosylase B